MSETLLLTKLYVPRPRPNMVSRPRLVERLNLGLHHGYKLTLISAPAGFGKSTLAAEWISTQQQPAAWLSLTSSDNNPTRFLTYFIAALQTILPEIGEGASTKLQSAQPASVDSILTGVINEISTTQEDFILVLDDYHLIDQPAVDNILGTLIEHLPLQMHLVIATREDPNLPLARLRAGHKMSELRSVDLRFTPTEAATFLNQVMELSLADDEVEVLGNRTEGWIAGLQLAALSMRGREDISGFIHAFAGDNRYVVDYLAEEVLQRQPERVRRFLLQTSILGRLCGPLCAALTGQDDSRGMLEELERNNLFVVSLDDTRLWYRYHHLFADVLQAHLLDEELDQITILNGKASKWYDENNLPEEAIAHALAAKNYEQAAEIGERVWPDWSGSFQSIAWLSWLEPLPDEVVRQRPVLCVAFAWAYLNAGRLEDAEAWLQDAERWFERAVDSGAEQDSPSRALAVVDEAQFRLLPASLATARAYHAQATGDVQGTVTFAQQAMATMPEGDFKWRGDATALLGLAYWTRGDLEAAHKTLADGLAGMKPLDIIVGTFVLADIKMTLGRLHEALRIFEHAIQLAVDHGEPKPIGSEDVYSGLSELHRERGDLDAAAQDLATSRQLGEQVELPDWQYRWCTAQARLDMSLGNLNSALDLLDEAQRLYIRTPLPEVRPFAALKARIWIMQGRMPEALGWMRQQELSVGDDLSFLREFDHITLARLLIAQGKSARSENSLLEANGLLDRLLKAAEKGGRIGSVIEILLLQARAYHELGDLQRAFVPLDRALALAEPEGYVRIFVDEGPLMAELLKEAAQQGNSPGYARRLLSEFNKKVSETAVHQPLVDPLSERELEVLGLLGTELSGPEIARELMISLNTMRTHTKNIYSKLGVNNRRSALRRADEMGLV